MRPSTTSQLLLLATLSACASQTSAEADWAAVQRERLERLYQPRDAGAQAPRVQGQPESAAARKHLDQIEPEVAGLRPFLDGRTPFTVSLDAGLGSQQVKVHGTRLLDRTDAASLRLTVDRADASGRGPSMQVRALSSDDDLFAGQFLSDGYAPAAASARVRGLDLFPHLRFDTRDGDAFAVAVRTGLFVNWLEVDHRAADVQRSWITVGPRVLAEPRVLLLGGADQHLDLFAAVGADLGASWFQEDYRGHGSTDSALRGSATAGLGIRYTNGRMSAEVGYELEHAWIGGVTSDLLGSDRRTETEQQRLFLGFSTQF
jgi:hypothetical protein